MEEPRHYWTLGGHAGGGSRTSRPGRRARRWLFDAVGVLGALVLILGAVVFMRSRQEREALVTRATAELRRVELELQYRAAARLPGLNSHGWPARLEESWFRSPGEVPRNPLLAPERPWVDLATQEEMGLDDPVVKMAADPRLAGFWYNPQRGVVRARVPVLVSDADALELYNRINGTHLASIFVESAPGKVFPAEESSESGSKDARARAGAIEISSTGQVERRPKR